MTAPVRTHFPVGPTILILVAVLAAVTLYPRFQRHNGHDPDRERLLLVVTFSPTPRSPEVLVRLGIDGDTDVLQDRVAASPWNRGLEVPRGARVTLHVTQSTSGRLACAILESGTNRVIDENERDDAGSIRCYHNRRG